MVELGALLGALAAAHASAVSRSHPTPAKAFAVTFLAAPVVGSMWGALVAALIHFAASLL